MFAGPLYKEAAETFARRQFFAGFVLPFVWMSNYLYFWKIQEENEVVRYWCKRSLLAFTVACTVSVVYWVCLHELYPNSSLWMIYPNRDYHQDGFFSKTLYG